MNHVTETSSDRCPERRIRQLWNSKLKTDYDFSVELTSKDGSDSYCSHRIQGSSCHHLVRLVGVVGCIALCWMVLRRLLSCLPGH